MKIANYIYTLIILFILVCCNKNNGATSFERITLKNEYVDLSKYLDFEFIPLETTKDNLIGIISNIKMTNDRIFIFDSYKANALFVFDKKGKYITQIGSPGMGPGEFAYLDTHYYGGIKKYQWVALPLAIHGVVVRKDGTKQEIVIGEKDEEPIFVITDLLVHLSAEQMENKADKVIEGEKLDLIVGNKPMKGIEKEAVKENILELLKKTYDIEEDDFISAELEIVPAGKAKDCGIDRSMIIGYGQDDRACAFTSLLAILDTEGVKRTTCCLLVDKEEIGSVGATGMHSKFFENTVAEIIDRMGEYSELKLRRVLANSKMLSCDVSAAFDPMYESVYEKENTAYFGRGIIFNKYTGSRGKSGSNDANAEYIAHLRDILEKNQIVFQTAELGKVDAGGGGTIAYILAAYGMEVIDSGVAVLNMHAPWEIVSKADIYEAYKGYKVFLKEG